MKVEFCSVWNKPREGASNSALEEGHVREEFSEEGTVGGGARGKSERTVSLKCKTGTLGEL